MRRIRLAIAVPVLVSAFAPSIALAQTDPVAMGHHAAANELGVLEYCHGRGAVGADAVSAQKAAITRLPPSAVSTDADEKLGSSGSLAAPNGQTATLSEIASKQGVSVDALCKKLGDGVIQANSVQSGTTMPNMPAMPAMPNMPNMPSMPH